MNRPPSIPAATQSLDDGEVLMREGEAAGSAYLLIRGEFLATQDGRELGRFGPGCVLGEMAPLSDQPRSATVVAIGPSVVERIERDDFLRWYREDTLLREALERQRVLYVVAAPDVIPLDPAPDGALQRILPGGQRVRVEHLDGCMRVSMDDVPEGLGTLRFSDRHGERRLLHEGMTVHAIEVVGAWPRLGEAVERMAQGTALTEAQCRRFERLGELFAAPRREGLVCVCAGARRADVMRWIAEGRSTVDALARHAGIGRRCQQCGPTVRALLDEADTPRGQCPVGRLRSARFGWKRVPLVGAVGLLKEVVFDPVGMVVRARQSLGDAVVVPIPTRFNLVYLGDDAYERVLDLPPDVAGMGPVMANVPTIGMWFPRAGSDHDSLQTLLLEGREIIADLVDRALASPTLDDSVDRAMARHLPSDGPVDDVFAPISALFSDVAAEWTVGTELWSALRTPCLSLLRDIHEGIDIPRATLAVTPARPFMKEFKATRAIEAPLREVIARHQATGCFPVLDRILTGPSGPLPTEDQAWMLLYVLWNATIYPGSYGAWAYADVWQHPEWHQGVLALQSATERQARYADAFQETVRLWPVASLVRALSEPVEVMSNGCTYSVGPGDVLGVFPWSRNRDPDRHSEPEQWDADRWTRHESSEGLFGRGAFGCVAVRFNQLLFGALLDGLFQRFDFQTTQPLPDRRCRVHLTYPGHAWSGRLVTRQDGS